MQISVLSGTFVDTTPDFRTSYPCNFVPVPKDTGISKGYLKPADGLRQFGTGPGIDRGAMNWNGVLYRVMGKSLVSVAANGVCTTLGHITGYDQVTFDYSFDRLAITANGRLYYWDTHNLVEVTDSDLGVPIDMIWIDGYFMTTDGTSVVVTDITDPMSISPFNYASSEVDPDAIVGLLKLRDEPYVLNRHTIEVFENVGGSGFPFQRIKGAKMMRGAIGTHAACNFSIATTEGIAFVGSGRDEPPAVWFGLNSQTIKLSTREIDTILQGYTEAQLATITIEARVEKGHQHLFIHLPDYCLVYDAAASAAVEQPVWFSLSSASEGKSQYRAKNLVWVYDKWVFGDPTSAKLGVFDSTVSSHYGDMVGWSFGTLIIYNAGMGCIIHELELVALPGRVVLGADPVVWTEHSYDGETWSQSRSVKAGKQGERNKRLVWVPAGQMNHYRMQRFHGTSDAHFPVVRLEARVEALN